MQSNSRDKISQVKTIYRHMTLANCQPRSLYYNANLL